MNKKIKLAITLSHSFFLHTHMSNNKEHHFCFAYRGERLRVTPFQELHFANVQGTSTLDGMQLVRVSLERKNGRRACTIPKLVQEYNEKSGTDPVVPIAMPGMAQLITCFKTNRPMDGMPILLRIEMDRVTSSRYWRWDAPEEPKSSVKKTKNPRFAGLEGLVRELNLDPASLCMQSAYDQVAKTYFQVKGVELKNSGTFPASDKDFLLAELRRHFDRERMFIVAPPRAEELSAAAKAIVTDGRLMDEDVRFKASQADPTPKAAPNRVVVAFFEKMLPVWADAPVVEVTFKQVLTEFNSENAGIYRSTCVLPFMAPFISSGSVETTGEGTLRIHVQRVRKQLTRND